MCDRTAFENCALAMRKWTISERIGATAALLVVIGFGLVAIGEPVWRIVKMTLPD